MTDQQPSNGERANSIVAAMRARPREKQIVPDEPVKPVSPGKRLWNRLKAFRARKPDTDGATGLTETNRKLAERLEALEDHSWEVRESEELHRSLAEAFGDIIVDRCENGNIVFANGFAKDCFDESSPLPKPEMQTNTNTGPVTRDIEVATRLGPRWFNWTDIELRDEVTGNRRIRSVGRDITNRKQGESDLVTALDEARSASEVKSRFLAMVSHEMRTPLNGIAGMAQLLGSTALDAAQKDHVDAIGRSGSALLDLVNDLLDSAQIDAGEMRLRPTATNLRQLVEQSAEVLAPHAAEKGLTIATYIDPTLPDEIMIDPVRLRQILLNLGGNAVKFTQKGGIAIEVTGFFEDSTATIKVAVVDSGPGLSADDRTRVFDEFAQTETGTARKHDGAGLGLFIAQQIAQLMRTSIQVSSVEDKGTRFYFTFDANVVSRKNPPAPVSTIPEIQVSVLMPPGPARSALLRTVHGLTGNAHAFDDPSELQVAIGNEVHSNDVVLIDTNFAKNAKFADLQKKRANKFVRWILVDHADFQPSAGGGNAQQCDGWLTWPVRLSSLRNVLEGKTNIEASTSIAHSSTSSKAHILLVEDNQINTLVARNFLEKQGFTVNHAPDGDTAIRLFENRLGDEKFNHVLLDLNMPGLDGWSVLARMRELETSQGATQANIIVLSADDRSETRSAALKEGADGFLAKPFDFDVLSGLLYSRAAA